MREKKKKKGEEWPTDDVEERSNRAHRDVHPQVFLGGERAQLLEVDVPVPPEEDLDG
jgi:hypothetical protein